MFTSDDPEELYKHAHAQLMAKRKELLPLQRQVMHATATKQVPINARGEQLLQEVQALDKQLSEKEVWPSHSVLKNKMAKLQEMKRELQPLMREVPQPSAPSGMEERAWQLEKDISALTQQCKELQHQMHQKDVSKLKERNSSMEMSIQECRDAAMSLVEQDRAMIKGDLVTLI